MLLGGASIVASGAISTDPRVADRLAMHEDFLALGADLWAAISAAEAEVQRDEQGRLFEPESV
jgi:hypothetical protein